MSAARRPSPPSCRAARSASSSVPGSGGSGRDATSAAFAGDMPSACSSIVVTRTAWPGEVARAATLRIACTGTPRTSDLGLPAPTTNVDGSVGWRLDDAAQRLVVQPGPRDDVAALGFECADERVHDALIERLEANGIDGLFLHCNRRHHSLAIFALPLAKRMHHFMLQAPRIGDIGLAYERARRHKVPLSLGLGQHPAPDETFSFYASTPSGFDFELGANSREIDPAGWSVHDTSTTSSWGHRATLRLKMKMAGAMLRDSFTARRPHA